MADAPGLARIGYLAQGRQQRFYRFTPNIRNCASINRNHEANHLPGRSRPQRESEKPCLQAGHGKRYTVTNVKSDFEILLARHPRVHDMIVDNSCCVLPELFESVGLDNASQRDDGVCAVEGPEHAGVLQALGHEGAAAGFDDA